MSYRNTLKTSDNKVNKMGLNLFDNYKKAAHSIDNRIHKLEKTWESPQLILNGCGKNPAEFSNHIEQFLMSIKEIDDELLKDKPCKNYLKDMDNFLEHCESVVTHLKQGCEEIGSVFAEFGYVGPRNGVKNESTLESSILILEQMASFSIDSVLNSPEESTEEIENIAPEENRPKSIATPVIKSLASVLQAKTALEGPKSNFLITPLREYSKESDFSPYYEKH